MKFKKRVIIDRELSEIEIEFLKRRLNFNMDECYFKILYGFYINKYGYITRGSTNKDTFDYYKELEIITIDEYLDSED